MAAIDAESDLFFAQAETYLQNHEGKVPTHSAHEYFLMLLRKVLETRKNGNYGIAAAYIVRQAGAEIIFYGPNTIITEGNPHGHAEMNATKAAVRLLQVPDAERRAYLEKEQAAGNIVIRKAPHTHSETVLYTTLEPCPMCTVGAVINSGLQHVVIGTEDEFAGQLQETRLSNLSPLWSQMAELQNLQVDFAQSGSATDGATFVPKELLDILNNLFFQTKEPLDAQLAAHGFLNVDEIGAIAAGYLGLTQ